MKPLCLNVENRIGRKSESRLFINVRRELPFLYSFDFRKTFKHALVVFKRFEFSKFFRMHDKPVADTFRQQRGKFFVRLTKPSSVRDSVRHVGEFLRIRVVEILENTRLDYFAMKFGNSVYRVRRNNRKVRHSRLTVRKYRHSFDFIPVPGKFVPHFAAESLIDFL